MLQDSDVLGYACATPWRSRSAYRYAVEISIYLRQGVSGRWLDVGYWQCHLNTAQD